LQTLTPGGVTVRWRTNTATNSRVRYGATAASLTGFTDVTTATTEHIVTITGLNVDTKYFYSIGSTTVTLAGGDASHFFFTAPATTSSRPTHIWVLGDSGTADNNARAVRDAYFNFNGSRYTDLMLMLGDNAYNSGTDSEFQAAVFNIYPSILQQTVLWPTLGNHDGLSADSATQTGPYYNIFSLPAFGEAGGTPSGTKAYYSFDFGDIHFICLESFETNRAVNAPMMTWKSNE
jgi:hypothetical protein